MNGFAKISAGPLALFIAWAFFYWVFPNSSPSLQASITDGKFGMLLGLFGGTVVYSACVVSIEEVRGIWMKSKNSNSQAE